MKFYSSPLNTNFNRLHANREPFFCLEIRPTIDGEETNLLLNSIGNLLDKAYPVFVSVTAHADNNPTNFTNPNSSSSIALELKRRKKIQHLLLHVTCATFDSKTHHEVDLYMRNLSYLGINDFFALTGDRPDPKDQQSNCFGALQLVNKIRSLPPSIPCIAVAGYPAGHPLGESFSADMVHLKKKVEAGADFIIAQFSLKQAACKFHKFVANCREMDIQVPVLPGILLFQSFTALERLSALAKVEIPKEALNALGSIRDNDQAVQSFSLFMAFQTCLDLLNHPAQGNVRGIHIFTANQWPMTRSLLVRLGFLLEVDLREWHLLYASMKAKIAHSSIGSSSEFHAEIQGNLTANVIHDGRHRCCGRGGCDRRLLESGICLEYN